MLKRAALIGCCLVAGTVYAKDKKKAEKGATATVEAKSDSKVAGMGTFSEKGGKVTFKLEVTGVPAGEHAVHIHEKGDCSSPDGKSAGGHWNPSTDEHGKWEAEHHHMGDIGNMTVGADGKGTVTLTTDKWSIGTGQPNDVIGKSIVIHGGVDDFKTQPTGNAGNRIGCAVIK